MSHVYKVSILDGQVTMYVAADSKAAAKRYSMNQCNVEANRLDGGEIMDAVSKGVIIQSANGPFVDPAIESQQQPPYRPVGQDEE